jgi:tetratricopeptide (TPR) repeat protein
LISPFVAALLWLGLTALPPPAAADDNQKVLEAFAAHLDSLPASDSVAAAKAAFAKLRDSQQDQSLAINAALMALDPAYQTAVTAADSGNPQAIAALGEFVTAADPFLAADAAFVQSRALLAGEQFEQAVPRLESLTQKQSEYSTQVDVALYFLGLAQAKMLRNADAIETLGRFLQTYPEAPERLRVSAWQQIQNLSGIEEGQLTDVHQRMDFSRRKLTLEETGQMTQDQQTRIVDLLAKLIRDQEKKECSSSNSKKNCENPGQSQAQQAKKPDDPQQSQSQTGGVSANPNGVAQRVYSDGPASPWSRLRDRSRDPAYSALKDQLPAKYRDIVERYTEKAQGETPSDGTQ